MSKGNWKGSHIWGSYEKFTDEGFFDEEKPKNPKVTETGYFVKDGRFQTLFPNDGKDLGIMNKVLEEIREDDGDIKQYRGPDEITIFSSDKDLNVIYIRFKPLGCR